MEGVDLMDQRNINEPHGAYGAPVPPAQPPVHPPVSPAAPEGQGKQSRFKNYCNRHGFRPFAVRIVILLLVLLIAFAIFTGISTATIVKSRTTALGLKDIGELATQAGFYTNVQMISGSREIFGINIPLTEKKYIFGYDGVIKAGIDFADIKVVVDEMTRVITVTLPEVKVLSNEIDENSFEIFDESHNIFNTLKVDDMNTSLIALKEESEAKAIENGLLENARRNAEVLVRGFLAGAFDLTLYTVEFN